MCSPALVPSLAAMSAHTMSAWSTRTFLSGHTHKHTYTTQGARACAAERRHRSLDSIHVTSSFHCDENECRLLLRPRGDGVPLLHPSLFPFYPPSLNKSTVSAGSQGLLWFFHWFLPLFSRLWPHLLLPPDCQSLLPPPLNSRPYFQPEFLKPEPIITPWQKQTQRCDIWTYNTWEKWSKPTWTPRKMESGWTLDLLDVS